MRPERTATFRVHSPLAQWPLSEHSCPVQGSAYIPNIFQAGMSMRISDNSIMVHSGCIQAIPRIHPVSIQALLCYQQGLHQPYMSVGTTVRGIDRLLQDPTAHNNDACEVSVTEQCQPNHTAISLWHPVATPHLTVRLHRACLQAKRNYAVKHSTTRTDVLHKPQHSTERQRAAQPAPDSTAQAAQSCTLVCLFRGGLVASLVRVTLQQSMTHLWPWIA